MESTKDRVLSVRRREIAWFFLCFLSRWTPCSMRNTASKMKGTEKKPSGPKIKRRTTKIWVNCPPLLNLLRWLSSLWKYRFRFWNRIKYVKMFISFRPSLRNKKSFRLLLLLGFQTVSRLFSQYSFAFFSLFVLIHSLTHSSTESPSLHPSLSLCKAFCFCSYLTEHVYTTSRILKKKTRYKMFNSV